jgi:hypothetical protein
MHDYFLQGITICVPTLNYCRPLLLKIVSYMDRDCVCSIFDYLDIDFMDRANIVKALEE